MLQVAEHRVTGGAFHQHAYRRAVALNENQIDLIVTGDQAGFHLCGPLVHQHHVRDLALDCGRSPTARFSYPVAAPEALGQFASNLPDRDDVNVAANRFEAGVHRRAFWTIEFECPRDFLRGPASSEPGMHFFPQRRMGGDVTPAALTGPAPAHRDERVPRSSRFRLRCDLAPS